MYVMVRHYRLRRPAAEVREAVVSGLIPILRASPGFHEYWLTTSGESEIGSVSTFETEAQAQEASQRAIAWVQAHLRHLVELPADGMFGGEVEVLT